MTRFSRCVTVGFAVSLTLAAGCGTDSLPSAASTTPPAPDPNALHTISGIVLEHTWSSQSPIAGLPLRIGISSFSPAKGDTFIDVTTDANGRYTAQVGAGMVSIAPASNSGYFAPCPAGTADNLAANATFDVHVVSAAVLSTTGTPASLPTFLYASGTVYEATGNIPTIVSYAGTKPVANALVEIGHPTDFSYSATLTDANGRYLVCAAPWGVGTDQYAPVSVSKDGYVPGVVNAALDAGPYIPGNLQLISK